MIKEITVTRHLASEADYTQAESFLAAIGLEPSKSWQMESGKGHAFLAPAGKIELVHPTSPEGHYEEIYVQVTSLDSVWQIAKEWLERHQTGLSANPERLGEIAESNWGARTFLVTPVTGLRLTLWEFTDPLKGKPVALEGDLCSAGMRFAIVVARWNAVITDRLLQGSLDALLRSGTRREDVEIVRVPGAWEIPSAARKLAESGNYDAIITLGLLLRGETAHYEAIYNEVSRGIGQSQQETGIPHSFGVLTCETLEQALDRAGLKAGNKGFEAASAAIEMVSLHRKIEEQEG